MNLSAGPALVSGGAGPNSAFATAFFARDIAQLQVHEQSVAKLWLAPIKAPQRAALHGCQDSGSAARAPVIAAVSAIPSSFDGGPFRPLWL